MIQNDQLSNFQQKGCATSSLFMSFLRLAGLISNSVPMKTSSLSRRVRVTGQCLGSRMSNGSKMVKMSSDFGQFSSHFNEIGRQHESFKPAEVGFAAVQLHCETQMGRHPEAARFSAVFSRIKIPKLILDLVHVIEVWRMNWPSSSFVSFGCSRRVLKTAVEKDANASTSASACLLLESKGDPAPKSLN